jgi:hypothetical protein
MEMRYNSHATLRTHLTWHVLGKKSSCKADARALEYDQCGNFAPGRPEIGSRLLPRSRQERTYD